MIQEVTAPPAVNPEAFRKQLMELKGSFAQLGQQMQNAAADLTSSGIPPHLDLTQAIQQASDTFGAISLAIHEFASSCFQEDGVPWDAPPKSLEEAEACLDLALRARHASEVRNELKRATAVTEAEGRSVSALADFKQKAFDLLNKFSALKLERFEEEEAKDRQLIDAIVALVKLVTESDTLDDEQCEQLRQQTATHFPNSLFIAAIRGHIELPGLMRDALPTRTTVPPVGQRLGAAPLPQAQVATVIPAQEEPPLPPAPGEEQAILSQPPQPSQPSQPSQPLAPMPVPVPAPAPATLAPESAAATLPAEAQVPDLSSEIPPTQHFDPPSTKHRIPTFMEDNLPAPPAPTPRAAANSFKQAVPELTQSLEELFKTTPTHEIIMAVILQTQVGPLDFKEIPKELAEEIAQVLQTWFAIARDATANCDEIRQILKALGLDPLSVEQTDSGRMKFTAMCSPLEDNSVLPQGTNGPLNPQSLRIACFWGRPDEQQIITEAGEANSEETSLLLLFGCLPDERRRHISESCESNNTPTLLIDDTLALSIFSSSENRLSRLFASTLPHLYQE